MTKRAAAGSDREGKPEAEGILVGWARERDN